MHDLTPLHLDDESEDAPTVLYTGWQLEDPDSDRVATDSAPVVVDEDAPSLELLPRSDAPEQDTLLEAAPLPPTQLPAAEERPTLVPLGAALALAAAVLGLALVLF